MKFILFLSITLIKILSFSQSNLHYGNDLALTYNKNRDEVIFQSKYLKIEVIEGISYLTEGRKHAFYVTTLNENLDTVYKIIDLNERTYYTSNELTTSFFTTIYDESQYIPKFLKKHIPYIKIIFLSKNISTSAFLDTNLNFIIPPQYFSISDDFLNDGVSLVITKMSNTNEKTIGQFKYGIIDTNYQEIIPPVFKYVRQTKDILEIDKSLFPFYYFQNFNNEEGVVNATDTIIPFKYRDIKCVTKSYFFNTYIKNYNVASLHNEEKHYYDTFGNNISTTYKFHSILEIILYIITGLLLLYLLIKLIRILTNRENKINLFLDKFLIFDRRRKY